jgi:hypothetical protein
MDLLRQAALWFNRNRRTILTVLFVLLLIQICTPRRSSTGSIESVKPHFEEPVGNELKSYEQLEYEQYEKYKEHQSPMLTTYIFLVVAVLVLFLVQRKRILHYLIPQRVTFGARFFSSNGIRLVKITIENNTRQTIEFDHPVVKFSSIAKNRKFRLTSGDFPLMLSSGTSHSITFSTDKMVGAAPDIATMPFVSIEISASNGKTYRTLPRFVKLG